MNKPFTQQVLEAAQGMDRITVQALLPRLPGRTKQEVAKAVQNLTKQGYLEQTLKRGRSDNGVFTTGAWALAKPVARDVGLPRVSCVWNLGSAPIEIPWMPGRKYQPLGAWA